MENGHLERNEYVKAMREKINGMKIWKSNLK